MTPGGPGIDSTGTYHGLNPEERAEKLRAVPDEVELIKGGRYYRWVMEQFRLLCWRGRASREESDLICDAIGRLIDGRSLGFARKLAVWLQSNIGSLLRELRQAIVAGIRAAYRVVTVLLLRAMGLLRATFNGLRRALSAGHGHSHRRWAYNLNDPKERKQFLARAREIAEGGGGPCPRCGQRIERRLLEIDSGIAFEEEGLCRCIYIALDRALREREGRLRWEAKLREEARARAEQRIRRTEELLLQVEAERRAAASSWERAGAPPSILDFQTVEEWEAAVCRWAEALSEARHGRACPSSG